MTTTETWRFDLGGDGNVDAEKWKFLFTFGQQTTEPGGPTSATIINFRFDIDNNFIPLAQAKADAEGLIIVDIDRTSFKAEVNMNSNIFAVSALVTTEPA